MASRRSRLRGNTQTRAFEIHRFRRGAVRKGLGIAFVSVVVILGVSAFIVFKFGLRPPDPRFWYWALGGPTLLFVPVGFYLWFRTRRLDEVHRRFQQAPSLPVRLVHDHDDAWIEGRIRCPRPRRPPHHRHRCSWYHLVVEESRGSGENRHWVKILDQTRRTRFWITDATREIEVHIGKASIDYPITTSRESGNRRYTLTRLPAAGRISACGVARRRKDVRVRDKERAPLDVEGRHARKDRMARVIQARSAEDPPQDLPQGTSFKTWRPRHEKSQVREERRAVKRAPRSRRRILRSARRRAKGGRARRHARRLMAKRAPLDDWHRHSIDEAHGVSEDRRLILTAHRHVPLMVTPLRRAQWHDRAEADELTAGVGGDVLLAYGIPALVWSLGCFLGWWATAWMPAVPIGLAAMLVVLLPSKIIGRYNRFVVYRHRIPNARAHIEADLKMRADLLPQLVTVVKAYAEYERGVQSHLAEVRAAASAGDDVTNPLRLLKEAYPDLRAQGNFDRLYADVLAIEEKIAFGRALLRDSITEYNDTVESFPSNFIASLTGFKSEPLP